VIIIPEGLSIPVLNLEISAERKNVSFNGTASRTPARMTKNSRTQAPEEKLVYLRERVKITCL